VAKRTLSLVGLSNPYRLGIALLASLFLVNGLGLASAYANPWAEDDFAMTTFEWPVNIDVLWNDSPDLDPLDPSTVNIVSNPPNGIVDVDPVTGVVDYLPDLGFAGTDSFAYTVLDVSGAVSNIAYVDIIVDLPPEPVICEFDAIDDGDDLWMFSGIVEHVCPETLTIQFGGLLLGHSVEVSEDGAFDYTEQVPFSGIVSVQTTDDFGQKFNVEDVFVN